MARIIERNSRDICIGVRQLTGSLRIWLFHMILLLLIFFWIGSVQGFTDGNLEMLLAFIRYASFFYIAMTSCYLVLHITCTPRNIFSIIRSVFGIVFIGAVYLAESYLVVWLKGY